MKNGFITLFTFILVNVSFAQVGPMLDTSMYYSYRIMIKDQTFFIDLDSNDVIRLSNRAFYKEKINDYSGAIDDYNRILKIDPNAIEFYYGRCMCYREMGKYDLSNEDLEILIRLDSNEIFKTKEKYILFKGYNNIDNGKYNEALINFNKVLEINPNNPKAYNNRGMAKYFLDDFEGALMDQNIAVKLDPNYPQAYGKRGDTKFMLGDFVGALIDLNRAIQLDPYNMSVYSNRAGVKVQLEDYKGAVEDCNIALQFDPNNIKVYNHRAAAYYGLGEFKKAEEDLILVEKLKNKK